MSTALAVINPSDFALLQEGAIEDMTEAIHENLAGGSLSLRHLTRIQMPAAGSTVWQVPTAEGEKNEAAITGIVILQQPRRVYYEKSMNEADGENNRPDCFSNDAKVGYGVRFKGEQPSAMDCADCPLAKFGPNGERPRCQLRRNLYVLREDDVMPVVVDLPPTSIKNVENYMASLIQTGTRYSHAVTEISLQKATSKGGNGARQNAYSEAIFKKVGEVERSDRPAVNDYKKAIEALVAQPVATNGTGNGYHAAADPAGEMEDIEL